MRINTIGYERKLMVGSPDFVRPSVNGQIYLSMTKFGGFAREAQSPPPANDFLFCNILLCGIAKIYEKFLVW